MEEKNKKPTSNNNILALIILIVAVVFALQKPDQQISDDEIDNSIESTSTQMPAMKKVHIDPSKTLYVSERPPKVDTPHYKHISQAADTALKQSGLSFQEINYDYGVVTNATDHNGNITSRKITWKMNAHRKRFEYCALIVECDANWDITNSKVAGCGHGS